MKLVLDWDGTCTVQDSLVAAVQQLGDPSVYRREYGSYGEALAAEVATIRCTAEEAARWAVDNVEVRSNLADPSPDGWRVRFRHEGVCPVCGDRCKRRSLPDERPIVFVGDGWSDRCASLAADRVFARAGLADFLDEQGVPYERYDTFHDVAAALS